MCARHRTTPATPAIANAYARLPSASRNRVAGVDGLEHLDQQSCGDFDAVTRAQVDSHIDDIVTAVGRLEEVRMSDHSL